MHIYIYIILSLKKYLKNFIGDPFDIIRIIISRLYQPYKISCGVEHTILFNDDNIYVCGGNTYGQLLFRRSECTNPYLIGIELLSDAVHKHKIRFSEIKCGGHHVCALTATGTLYVWGRNSFGQLGLGDNHDRDQARRLLSDVKTISCGNSHTIIQRTKSLETYAFGNNMYGQLGLGDYVNYWLPKKVQLGNNFILIKCGAFHTMALTTQYRIYAWGRNTDQQLGFPGEI